MFVAAVVASAGMVGLAVSIAAAGVTSSSAVIAGQLPAGTIGTYFVAAGGAAC
ncbi:MAG: hypothetical protein LBL96_11195 [Clostridiales bacterium]|nr:hypothetical protein [Clostridiales bacterium]